MAATKEPPFISSQDDLEIKKIQKDILWGLYQDVRSHARHVEILRANAVNYMLGFTTVLLAVITWDKGITMNDLPLSIILCLIGLITALFSASYAELYFRNRERAERIRTSLDASFFQNGALTRLYAPKRVSDAGPRSRQGEEVDDLSYRFKWFRDIIGGSTHWFWILLPGMVFAAGIILIYMCLFHNVFVSA